MRLLAITIPQRLRASVAGDHSPARHAWLAGLRAEIIELADTWELRVGGAYLPGGQCAWVAPALGPAGERLALKVGWRHPEAEHEADALRLWDGDGAVRCLADRTSERSLALLLERCEPGTPLSELQAEEQQDLAVAGLLRRLWAHEPSAGHRFGPLEAMCAEWADDTESELDAALPSVATARAAVVADPGLVRAGLELLRSLPRSAERSVLLCTDLHAENVLAGDREPWLMIDPKPYLGDPAYDAVQHMLNCEQRLAADPAGMARRMAELLEIDPERVRLWLFARCAQESLYDETMVAVARRLAP